MNTLHGLTWATSFCFSYYGIACLFSARLIKEFARFGLSHQQRVLTGILQLLGAIGLSLCFWYPEVAMAASAGLTLLMLLGFGVRLKIKDGVFQSFPSFFFMCLNAYFCFRYFEIVFK